MNPIKYLIGRLLYPGTVRFVNGLSQASVKAAYEMQSFDEEVKMLCYNWLGEGPHSFATDLFLKREEWNKTICDVFQKSMRDAEACFTLTQGYYLKFLKNLMRQDPKYKKFSQAKIEANIRSKMANGNKILAATAEFEEAFQNACSPDDFAMCYMEKILAIQYPDEAERSARYFEILKDAKGVFGLNAYAAESLKFAKQVDSQSGAT